MKMISFFFQAVVTILVFPVYMFATLVKVVGDVMKDLLNKVYTIFTLLFGMYLLMLGLHGFVFGGGRHFFRVILNLIVTVVVVWFLTCLAFYIQMYLMHFTEVVINVLLWIPTGIMHWSHKIFNKYIGKLSVNAEKIARGIG